MKRKICSIEGCQKSVFGQGLCSKHYWRWKRYGRLDRKYEQQNNICSVESCSHQVYAKNLCNKHWQRKRKYGSIDRNSLKQPWRNSETWNDYFDRSTKKNDTTGCIEWIAHRDEDGYGRAWDNSLGRSEQAHRLAYKIYIGPIPKGKIICHHCDNPSCVNTDHLYAGTHKDNVRDKMERGRLNIPTGEKSSASKLTREQAIEVIKRRKNGEKKESIAKDYGISHWTVGDILKGKSWSDIDRDSIQGEATKDAIGRIKNTQTKLSESQVKQIKTKLNKGSSLNQLAIEFNVSKKLISNIKKGVVWNHVQPRKAKRRKRTR